HHADMARAQDDRAPATIRLVHTTDILVLHYRTEESEHVRISPPVKGRGWTICLGDPVFVRATRYPLLSYRSLEVVADSRATASGARFVERRGREWGFPRRVGRA